MYTQLFLFRNFNNIMFLFYIQSLYFWHHFIENKFNDQMMIKLQDSFRQIDFQEATAVRHITPEHTEHVRVNKVDSDREKSQQGGRQQFQNSVLGNSQHVRAHFGHFQSHHTQVQCKREPTTGLQICLRTNKLNKCSIDTIFLSLKQVYYWSNIRRDVASSWTIDCIAPSRPVPRVHYFFIMFFAA